MAEKKQKEELYVTEVNRGNPWQLRYPLHYGIYKKALICILERKLRWSDSVGEKGEELRDCDNIIAFVGGRGSGKTTAMMYFCQELEKNKKKFEEVYEKVGLEQTKARFYCLETIELSMLEESEDIFELILAKMLERAQEKLKKDNTRVPEFDEMIYRTLCIQFDKVYRSYSAVKFKKQMEEYGESPLSRLKNWTGSLSVKKEFVKLLEQFFKFVQEKDGSEETVLVIPFDDLDLNIKYGYEMLETVYRYMRHQQVIILLAIEQKQMEHICKNHILNAFDIRNASVQRIEDVELHCEKLAKDYLKKMIPLDARVYMPDIKMESIQVAEKEKDDNPSSQKMFIMGKYAHKTGIYYDACGRKRHFCESDTLRTLVDYVHFLNSLKDVDINEFIGKEKIEEKQFADFQENYEQIYGDTVNRMASEMLSGSNELLFQKLLQEDVSRWGRFVYKLYLSKTNNKTEENDIEELSFSYCYGDLLKSIYYWGRKREEDKTLIHMILALFSLEFTKEFVWYNSKKDDGKHGERLRELQGRTLGGRWVNEGLPLADVGPGVKTIAYGYIPDIYMVKFKYGQFRLLSETYSGNGDLDELNEVIGQIKERKMIETLEMISLFFRNVKSPTKTLTDFKYVFRCARGMYSLTDGEQYQVMLQYDIDEEVAFADFDIWGVVGCIGFENRILSLRKDIFQKLKMALKEVYGEGLWETAQAERKLDDLQEEFNDRFQCRKGEVAVPYYNLDLTYNILKRIRQKSLRKNPLEIPNKDCASYIVKMYRMIEKELQNEADEYKKAGGGNGLDVTGKYFSENPYIMELLDREEKLPVGFDAYMGELIKSISPLEYSGVEQ